MNKNIKTEKQSKLIRIAKKIVSFVSENETVDKDIKIFNDMRKYNNMPYPGQFIIISAPFLKISKFKQDLKKIGFLFDPSTKEWYIFHKKLSNKGYDFRSLVNLIKDKVYSNPAPNTTNNPDSPSFEAPSPVTNTGLKQSGIKLTFGRVQIENNRNLCFIVDPNMLCQTSTGEFIKNLTVFANDCAGIVEALSKKFPGILFHDNSFNNINKYEMHGDGQIFKNLLVLAKDNTVFNEIKEFFKQNNINYNEFTSKY